MDEFVEKELHYAVNYVSWSLFVKFGGDFSVVTVPFSSADIKAELYDSAEYPSHVVSKLTSQQCDRVRSPTARIHALTYSLKFYLNFYDIFDKLYQHFILN